MLKTFLNYIRIHHLPQVGEKTRIDLLNLNTYMYIQNFQAMHGYQSRCTNCFLLFVPSLPPKNLLASAYAENTSINAVLEKLYEV